jgi:hypothetical protein
MSSSVAARIQQMHDDSIAQLIESHKRRTEEPLVLAVQYELEHPTDVFLLEVLDDFPGGEEDELLTTEFGPSPNLLLLGTLHLSLGSPGQVEHAVRRGDVLLARVRHGKILFSDGSPTATKLEVDLFGSARGSR